MNLLEKVDAINVYKRGANRAPHKPLYLLLLFAAVQKQKPRLHLFSEIEQLLGNALRLFGPRTASVHPEYPFWWLQQDNLGEVWPNSPTAYELRKNRSDPKKTSLLKVGAKGGLLDGDYKTLLSKPELLGFLCHRILDKHFPISLHEDIMDFFDFSLSRNLKPCHNADGNNFREEVLRAYGFKCAVCGFQSSQEVGFAGVESTEIIWRNHGGASFASNGIAMTTIHRKLFHLGLFTLTPEYQLKLSVHLSDGKSIGLKDGKRIQLPVDATQFPSLKSLDWHRRWVFRM
jgi:putative restriction endonuclease